MRLARLFQPGDMSVLFCTRNFYKRTSIFCEADRILLLIIYGILGGEK
jgi:hypothetical protein